MTSKEAVKVIKSIVETLDDYAFYTIEDKEAFRLAIEALEREGSCKNQVAQSFLCSACGCYCEYNDEYPVEYNYCPNCGRKVEK